MPSNFRYLIDFDNKYTYIGTILANNRWVPVLGRVVNVMPVKTNAEDIEVVRDAEHNIDKNLAQEFLVFVYTYQHVHHANIMRLDGNNVLKTFTFTTYQSLPNKVIGFLSSFIRNGFNDLPFTNIQKMGKKPPIVKKTREELDSAKGIAAMSKIMHVQALYAPFVQDLGNPNAI